jgi:glutamate-ammonia-ligase adenylyltransferase
MSDGPRSLQTRTYFARLTQALITALTAQLPEGRLYEVDMRLRPSGRQGPVASGWASYKAYQKEEAWTWEHLALTRAQALDDGALAQDWHALRDDILRHTQKDVLSDAIDMRARLAEAKPASDPWDVKNGAGGVQDIELFAQASALNAGLDKVPRDTSAQLATIVANGWLNDTDLRTITLAYETLWAVKAMQAELSIGTFDAAKVGAGAVGVLNVMLGAASEGEALAKVVEARRAARECIGRIMPLGGAKKRGRLQ